MVLDKLCDLFMGSFPYVYIGENNSTTVKDFNELLNTDLIPGTQHTTNGSQH